MNKHTLITFILGLSLFLLAARPVAAISATLKFAPNTLTIPIGETKTVALELDPADNRVIGVDVFLRYDTRVLEIVSIDKTTAFESIVGTQINNQTGSARFALVHPHDVFTTTASTVVNVRLRAKQVVDNTALSFDFINGRTQDTNVVTSGGKDVLGSVGFVTITTTQASDTSDTSESDEDFFNSFDDSEESTVAAVVQNTPKFPGIISPLADEEDTVDFESPKPPASARGTTLGTTTARLPHESEATAAVQHSVYGFVALIMLFILFVILNRVRKALFHREELQYS